MQPLRLTLTALVAFAIAGMFTELMLFSHHEDAVQLIPLVLLAGAAAALAALTLRPTPAFVRLFQAVMVLLVAGGLAGIVLHFRANMEFQLDIDPQMARWTLFWKVMQAKAPPALAPGAMVQLGLLGLVLSALYRPVNQPETMENTRVRAAAGNRSTTAL